MPAKHIKKIDGHRVSEPTIVPIGRIKGRISQNALIDREADATLVANLKQDGQLEDILVDRDFRIARGWRRFQGLKRAGAKTVSVIMIKDDLTADEWMRIVSSDFIRQNLSEEDQLAQIEAHFQQTGELEKLLAYAPRGVNAKADPFYKRVHFCFPHLSLSRCKHYITAIRKKHAAKPRRALSTWEMNGTNANYVRRRAQELEKINEALETAKGRKEELERELIEALPSNIKVTGGKGAKLTAVLKSLEQYEKSKEETG